ncbi:MAG: hypothetical protein QM753_14100 [Thermomicrobiales bacterium]
MTDSTSISPSTSTIPPQLVPGTPPEPEPEPAAAPVMREAVPTAEDWQRYDNAIKNRNATYKAMLITMGVIMAPFIGLLYDMKLAVGLLGVALAFTTIVAWMGANRANPALRPRIRVSALLNGVLALVTFGVLAAMLTAN